MMDRGVPPGRSFVGRRASRGALFARLWLVLAVLSGCTCGSSPRLATLQLTLGVVERDFAARQKAWTRAEVGAAFGLGDGVQTRAGSTALLQLAGDDQLSMEPETRIRFANTPPQGHGLDMDLELGAISVLAARSSLALRTPAGLAHIAPGTRVALSRSEAGVRFVVQVGQAVFGAAPLEAGQGMLIGPEGKLSPLAAEPAPAAPPPPGMTDAAVSPDAAEATAAVSALVTGHNARIRTETGWTELPQGAAQLAAGTELQLQHSTSVRLERDEERAVLQENGRYIVAPRPGVLVAAAAGSLSAGSSGKVRIEVPGGVIEVVPRGQASVRLRERVARVEVRAREALLETLQGVQRVGAGERATVLANGKLRIEGRSLGYADVELEAGESLVIHDPAPPTAVRFSFAGVCPEAGVIQLFQGGGEREYAAGERQVALAMAPGKYRYELRCSEGPAVRAEGHVQVLKDAGTRRVAAHPPTTTLQADGRDYTVLYQNRLPKIELVWRDAPAGTALQLTHEFENETRTLSPVEPSHAFAPGSLREGRHVLHFEGGGKISRRTTVTVVFDNAAPKASISTPAALAVQPGEPVTISGTALAGWDVSIERQPAQRDAQGRFSLPVAWPHERRALAVRLSHPERGVHVYLRRARP